MQINASDQLAITVISIEEQVAGRLDQIRKSSSQNLVAACQRLRETISVFSDFEILDYEFDAEKQFWELRKLGIRIGTLDLRIASVALVQNGIVLTVPFTRRTQPIELSRPT